MSNKQLERPPTVEYHNLSRKDICPSTLVNLVIAVIFFGVGYFSGSY